MLNIHNLNSRSNSRTSSLKNSPLKMNLPKSPNNDVSLRGISKFNLELPPKEDNFYLSNEILKLDICSSNYSELSKMFADKTQELHDYKKHNSEKIKNYETEIKNLF